MSTDLVFAIEAIGVAGSVDRQFYFARGSAPSWDSSSAWVNSCWSGFPGEVSSSVSFIDGDSSIGSLSLELFAQAQTQAGDTIASIFYDQTRVSIAELTTAIANTTDTTVYLDSTTLAGQKVIIGRECIYLGTHAGGGRYNSCTRGLLATQAAPHGIGPRDYVQVFNASNGPLLRWRRITLYRVDLASATSYSALEQLWSGVVHTISAPTPERIRIDADASLSILQRMTALNTLWRAGATGSSHSLQRLEQGIIGTTADALLSVDGECVVNLEAGTWGDHVVVRLRDSSIYRALDSTHRAQALPDSPKEIWQCFHASATRADSTTTLPYSRNLLTLFLQLLTSSDSNTNGSYDLGHKDLGLGIPQEFVDVAQIESVRDTLGSSLDCDLLVLGLDGKPLEVFDFIRKKLVAYGVAIVDKAGKISVASLADNDPDAPTLTQGVDLLGPAAVPAQDPPVQVRRLDMCVDAYTVHFGAVPGHEPIIDTFTNVARRQINIFGERQAPALDVEAISSRNKIMGFVSALLQRFNDSIPDISVSALRTRTDVELGDLVALTHSHVYQATGGTRSVSDELMLCIERTLSLETNVLKLRFLDVGALYARTGIIAPAATVASAAGSVITLWENVDDSGNGFASGLMDAGEGEYDVDLFVAGDVLSHCNSLGVHLQALEVASTAGGTTLTVKSTPSPSPVDGDVIRLASYDTATARAQGRFAWLADASGTLGSASATGKEYTF